MNFTLQPVLSASALARFIRIPWELPDRRPNEVPPLLADEREFHDPKRNAQLESCTVQRWIAWHDQRPVGRIMALVHHGYNAAQGSRTARFYALDSVRDEKVVHALLSQAEEWAREQKMDRIIGPFGFSDKDPQGLQVEGFEHLPVVATPVNSDWLPPMVERYGYAPFEDMVSYRLAIPDQLPEHYHAVAERCLGRLGLHRVPLRSKGELRKWVIPVLELVNATYGDLLGFTPMTVAEMKALAQKYMFILDPELVHLIADANDVAVAFVIASPDMSEGLRRANGKLFPLGFLHILLAMRRSRQMDLLLGAVRPDLQGRGLTAALGIPLFATAKKRGFTHLDSHLVMERNVRMRAELERLGAVIWKRYRVYQRML